MINLLYINLVIGLVALLVAAFCDIKTREVPDWLNFSLLAFALGSAVILSIYHGYPQIIINSIAGLIVGLLIGLLMFYTGQWGGGDAKLIIALSALIGFSISDIMNSSVPLLIVFLLNLLLAGAIYGIGFSIFQAITHHKQFKEEVEHKLRSKPVLLLRIILLVVSVAAFIFLLVTKSIESAMTFGFALAMFLFFYLWIFITTVEKTCMMQDIKVGKLTEGDWIIGDVMKGKKVLVKHSKTGITLQQIALLKKQGIRTVKVKVGIPFVPSFLLAYIITLLFGNWLSSLI